MHSLIIIAHGSRRENSNKEVADLAGKVAKVSNDSFDHVQCAFLELAEPSIPDSIIQCIEKGATEITVLPYFLAAGRHVVEDIPHEISLANHDASKVKINIKPHLGAAETIVDTIYQLSV